MSFTQPISRLLLIFFVFLITKNAGAQSTTLVQCKVAEKGNIPLAYATIKAIDGDDSTRVLQKLTDSLGRASFRLNTGKTYRLVVTALNYKPLEKGIVTRGNEMPVLLQAEPLAKNMGEVVVTSTRPLMRQEDDKTIIEPEALAAASTNAYEILEKTPGVFLDQDGNVYLSSTTPSAIYINAREMKMSTADIATMLKNLPPNAVAKIEIIRSPSAKYDASGTGGIINIVLKKGFKPGLTGSVNVGVQQGTYGNQVIGFSLNNNDGKKSTYINMNAGRRNNYENIISERRLNADTSLLQNAFTRYASPFYYVGYGYSNSFSKKFDFDFSGNASYSTIDNNTWNSNAIRKGTTVLSDNMNTVNNGGHSFYIGNGVNGKLKLDTIGSEWETNLFYSHSTNVNDQLYGNNILFPVNIFFGGNGSNTGKRDYGVIKSDLKLKLKHRFTFETGFRSSFMWFTSNADYYTQSGGVTKPDASRNNRFKYFENINAAYVQGAKTVGKDFIIKMGVRAENTNMRGNQYIPKDTSFTIHRTDLFPYIYLSKKLMSIAGYDLRAYLVYRRTLSRPSYDFLNPFPRYIDQYLFEAGNPSLRPQFTNNYEANISVDERPLLAVGLNQTKDIFTNVIYPADSSRLVRTYDNLGQNKEVYFRALGAIPPGKKYFFVLGAQYNHNFYDGIYNNAPLSYKRGTWTLFTYHQLKLGKLSQFTMNGFVRFKGLQQFYELGDFGSLTASINRQLFKQKLVVTLSVNDIFYTNKNSFTINQANIVASGNRFADTRRFGINLRYNFGIKKKEEQNNMFNVDAPSN